MKLRFDRGNSNVVVGILRKPSLQRATGDDIDKLTDGIDIG